MAELAVALDEPGADLLLLAWFEDLMGEGAGRACGAGADFEKFARDMGEVLGWGVARKGAGVRRRGTVGVGRTYPWRKAYALGPCLSRGLCLCHVHVVRDFDPVLAPSRRGLALCPYQLAPYQVSPSPYLSLVLFLVLILN